MNLTTQTQFLAPLATRLVIGYSFLLAGRGKWMNIDQTASFFSQVGIPLASINAGLVASVEVVGGVCLLVGLGTRVFSGLLACVMAVAMATADREMLRNAFGGDLTVVTSLVFFLFLAWLIFYGPGPVSLDGILGRTPAK